MKNVYVYRCPLWKSCEMHSCNGCRVKHILYG